MEVDEIIKRIELEKKKGAEEVSSDEGLLRLQEVAMSYDGEYRLVWSDVLQAEIEARPKKKMHMTGMPAIDELTGGFREQMMIGLGAHSGHGKTAMGLFLLKKYEYLNPVMIPIEQSSEELIEQRLANKQFVPKFLSPMTEKARVDPDWIEERIVEGIAKYNSKMVVIDHLGYIDPDKKFERASEPLQIERKLQAIKHLAKKWNVIVVILIHITQLDESKPPSLLNLKGSSAIKQECDKVILLWRQNEEVKKIRVYTNETLFSLQKNRWSGRNGNAGLSFNTETGDYESTEKADSWVKQMEAIAESDLNADTQF
jgi:replicative DNA helicase